ncbi:MAG: hypothetical protein ACXWD8_19830, partial [Mycobacterium sp.]
MAIPFLRTPPALLCGALLLVMGQSRPLAQQVPPPASAEQFSDSHFHLTNYIQEGTDVRKYVEIMAN